MSKYIRTKDGIYEAKKNKVGAWITKLPYKIFDSECVVIKQSNTLEELCDVYVIKGEFGIYLVYFDELDSHAMGQTKEMLLSGQLEAYGAIWVIDSNGAPTLKSVAKANEKGKLELL